MWKEIDHGKQGHAVPLTKTSGNDWNAVQMKYRIPRYLKTSMKQIRLYMYIYGLVGTQQTQASYDAAKIAEDFSQTPQIQASYSDQFK